MKRSPKFLVIIIIIAAIAIAATAYRGYRSTGPAKSTAATTPPASVAVSRGDVRNTVAAPGKVHRLHELVLTARVSGTVADVSVRPGDSVKAGEAVVHLEAAPLQRKLEAAQNALEQAEKTRQWNIADARLGLKTAQARLDQARASTSGLTAAEAEVKTARAALRALQHQGQESKNAEAQARLANAAAQLRQAQSAYDQVKLRPDIAMLPESLQLERATNDYAAARARLDQLRQNAPVQVAEAQARLEKAIAQLDRVRNEQAAAAYELEILKTSVEKQELRLQRLAAGVDPALEQAVQEARLQRQAAVLTAPSDGVVLQVTVRPGESIQQGQTLIILADPGATEVYATVIEEDLPLVKPGQKVEIFFDASADAEGVSGTVSRIVPQRTSSERPLYPVYITLEKTPPDILPGMTADATIIVAQRQNVLRLPRSLVRSSAKGAGIVRVWKNGQIEEREISVGLRGDVYIEILDGLNEGDEVVAS